MYEEEDITRLLPAVWCESYWTDPPQKIAKASIDPERYRMLEEPTESMKKRGCDPTYRKSAVDPRQSNSAWVELIDVKRAWELTDLTDKQRRAMFLAYGLPPGHRFTQEQIAHNQGVAQQVISRRLDVSIKKMLAFLNGSDEYVPEEEA